MTEKIVIGFAVWVVISLVFAILLGSRWKRD